MYCLSGPMGRRQGGSNSGQTAGLSDGWLIGFLPSDLTGLEMSVEHPGGVWAGAHKTAAKLHGVWEAWGSSVGSRLLCRSIMQNSPQGHPGNIENGVHSIRGGLLERRWPTYWKFLLCEGLDAQGVGWSLCKVWTHQVRMEGVIWTAGEVSLCKIYSIKHFKQQRKSVDSIAVCRHMLST